MTVGRSIGSVLLLGLAFAACAAAAPASSGIAGSPLALASVPSDPDARLAARLERATGHAEAGGREDWLAQRVITREWGASDDTNYVEVEVPGYRSEGWALLLSSIVPGTGELSVGEGSGWLFLLAEAGAWTARVLLDHRADEHQNDAAKFAGSPYGASSEWSLARWAAATSNPDTLSLQQLYAGDAEAFYHRIGGDDRYAAGWASAEARSDFLGIESNYQRQRRSVRYANGAIVFVHVVSALDALHAAREHNLPLQRNLKLKLGGTIDPSGESMALAVGLERRF
jgi:hypothetical protein